MGDPYCDLTGETRIEPAGSRLTIPESGPTPRRTLNLPGRAQPRRRTLNLPG